MRAIDTGQYWISGRLYSVEVHCDFLLQYSMRSLTHTRTALNPLGVIVAVSSLLNKKIPQFNRPLYCPAR